VNTHDPSRTPGALLRRARLMFTIVGAGLPLLVTAIGSVIIPSWLPDFNSPVITHWGADGADRFGPASTYLWLLILLGAGLPAVLVGTTIAATGTRWSGTPRFLGALSAGMATFGLVASVGSLLIQRKLEDAADLPGIGGVLGAGLISFFVVGAMAWGLQPRVHPEEARALESRHAVHIQDGERVVWVGTASMPSGAMIGLVSLLVALAGLAVFMVVAGIEGRWVVVLVAALVAFAVAATTAFRVRVTPEGFSARSFIGWPRKVIPLADVESARAVDVSPFAEFGGWRWRTAADGRTGIVMRRGAAIEVSRRGKRAFIVTIDGAQEAAALLQAYVEQTRGDTHTEGMERP
jgi:hypothetical protein